MQTDITAIIRSAGERTKDLCYQFLSEQVPAENIITIRESPHRRAVERSLELGIEFGRRWTLCVDADMLLRRNGVQLLSEWASVTHSSVLRIESKLFDKLFGGPRQAGPYLYRTALLPIALKCIPPDGVSLRAESFAVKQMEALGYPSVWKDWTVGLHDFEQYYRDIYRKAFVHAHKSPASMQRLEPLWQQWAPHDPDYQVALWGLQAGRRFEGDLIIDVRRFPQDIDSLLRTRGWQEKRALDPVAIGNVDTLVIESARMRASAGHKKRA